MQTYHEVARLTPQECVQRAVEENRGHSGWSDQGEFHRSGCQHESVEQIVVGDIGVPWLVPLGQQVATEILEEIKRQERPHERSAEQFVDVAEPHFMKEVVEVVSQSLRK